MPARAEAAGINGTFGTIVTAKGVNLTQAQSGAISHEFAAPAEAYYYVAWAGAAIDPSGVFYGYSAETSGSGYVRAVNCDEPPTGCGAHAATVSLYQTADGVAKIYIAPVTYNGGQDWSDLMTTAQSVYYELRQIRSSTGSMEYNVANINYYVSQLGSKLDSLQSAVNANTDAINKQTQAQQSANENANEQKTNTDKLKGEGDTSKYETDDGGAGAGADSMWGSLSQALGSDGDCKVNLSADGSRLNIGEVDFCAGSVPSWLSTCLDLMLFTAAIMIPVQFVRMVSSIQQDARDGSETTTKVVGGDD